MDLLAKLTAAGERRNKFVRACGDYGGRTSSSADSFQVCFYWFRGHCHVACARKSGNSLHSLAVKCFEIVYPPSSGFQGISIFLTAHTRPVNVRNFNGVKHPCPETITQSYLV